MIQILFALLAGILTVGAPCILPLLPILLGGTVGQTNKTRPLMIVFGFILTFTLFGVFLSFLTRLTGFDPNNLRSAAIILLGLFGLLMFWPEPFERLANKLVGGAITRASQKSQGRSGSWGGFVLGLTLGLIWTPCAGPVLGAILTLIATQSNLLQAVWLMLAYAIGAGLPMLLIAYGSQYLTTKIRGLTRYSRLLQKIFGLLLIALAIAMFYGYDLKIEAQLANYFPAGNLESSLIGDKNASQAGLSNYGPAPEFTGINHWLNSPALTLKDLRGKVVLVDFWTYSCINCLRTLPYVTRWYDTYKDKGLVVVGVHSPEFNFEKDTGNVAMAIKEFKINYPVAQDNDYGTWNAYGNQYWPAEYLIDQSGNIVYTHFGEGNYDHTENTIRQLLGLASDAKALTGGPSDQIRSPEMYFGTDRLANLTYKQSPSSSAKAYSLPANLSLNEFALEGQWQFSADKILLAKAGGKIKLHFSSGKIFIVAASANKNILKITVDGQTQDDVPVSASQLYTLFDSNDYREHTIEIQIPDAGFEAFTFTFG